MNFQIDRNTAFSNFLIDFISTSLSIKMNYFFFIINYFLNSFCFKNGTVFQVISSNKIEFLFRCLVYIILMQYFWKNYVNEISESNYCIAFIALLNLLMHVFLLSFIYNSIYFSDLLKLPMEIYRIIIFNYFPVFFSIILSTTLYLCFVLSDSDIKNESYKFKKFFAFFLGITYTFFFIINLNAFIENVFLNLSFVFSFYFICIKCFNFSKFRKICHTLLFLSFAILHITDYTLFLGRLLII